MIGKKLHNYPEVEVKGTPESVKTELLKVFGDLRSPRFLEIRENAIKVGKRLRKEHDEMMPKYFDKLLQAM